MQINSSNNMDKDTFEKIKMVYSEHCRQITVLRQKIHTLTEKTVGILLLLAGWGIISKTQFTPSIKIILVLIVCILCISSCVMIFTNNRSYLANARVIKKINIMLNFFENGKYLINDSLYPQKWKNFGDYGKISGIIGHWSIIISVSILTIMSILIH